MILVELSFFFFFGDGGVLFGGMLLGVSFPMLVNVENSQSQA